MFLSNAGVKPCGYKGYPARPIDFDREEKTFSGTVAGLKDVIHFEGATADELYDAFKVSVDEYLALCQERGEEPDRPFNGKILVRTAPDLHRKAAQRAAAEGISLSQWISRQIPAVKGTIGAAKAGRPSLPSPLTAPPGRPRLGDRTGRSAW